MSRDSRHFAWVLNLDAEFELERPSYHPPARLLAQLAQHGQGSRALLGANDVLLAETADLVRPARGRRPLLAPTLVGRAWCPTPRALAVFEAAGVSVERHPPLEVLKRVNHRRFALEVGGGLPHQRYLTERAELATLLERAERPWLLKRAFGFAGRGQMRVHAGLDAKQWAWVDASLRLGGLVVEPLVVPLLELSAHGFIWPEGRAELGRVCVQSVNARGVFQGVRLASGEPSALEGEALLAKASEVASALFRAGYFGPFGIDAFRYELEEQRAFCALSEINARFSMGFVTGFPRHPSELWLGDDVAEAPPRSG